MCRRGAAVQRLCVILCFCAGAARANGLIFNGQFDAGNLDALSLFTTPNGALGVNMPAVIDAADIAAADIAGFPPGQATAAGISLEGSGIYQNLVLPSGPQPNALAGTAELLLDMRPIWGYNLGDLTAGQIVRQAITVDVIASAGPHSFGIQFLSPGPSLTYTPFQYVDNFWVEDQWDAPEPSTFVLIFFGLAVLAVRARLISDP